MATKTINNVNNEIDNSENLISNALQITNNLLCPHCAKPHIFEFMLIEHLKKCHTNSINASTDDKNVLKSQENNIETNKCPFCEVKLVHSTLLPKHITKSHGQDLLLLWQHQTGNLKNYQTEKANEPSILYAECSPGLSNIFDSIIGRYDEENVPIDTTATVSPQIKSILKKTPNKSRIIFSPAAAAIRRSKSDVVKRSISVRRELRFDPSTKSASESLSPDNSISTTNPVSNKRSFKFSNPFNFYKKGTKAKTLGNNKLITSTPINFLDDDQTDSEANKKNWKATIRNNRPLFIASERYQCAYCKKTWENNTELLNHLSDNHKSIKHWLRPQYRCSLCGSTYYSNTYLVRHCHLQHTPVKMARKIIRS